MSSTSSSENSLATPRHVAIIMDGNGRWAKKHFMPRAEGHRQGMKTVRSIIEESRTKGVRYLTLFAFSSENWKRPPLEVQALMALFSYYLEHEIENLLKNQIRFRIIGERSMLPKDIQEKLAHAEKKTADQTGMDLILAVSYGGRLEIVETTKKMAQRVAEGSLELEAITEKSFSEFLYAPEVPEVDLLIRTSGEMRLSNFLLWQLAYSEIVVSPVLWPDFSKEEYTRCLGEFGGRNRRFGMTDEQLEPTGVS